MTNDYKSIVIVSIHVEANSGAAIGDCLRDCMKLAINEWRNVELKHNDRIYRIKVNAMLESICADVK
jgi:hypothetical protein